MAEEVQNSYSEISDGVERLRREASRIALVEVKKNKFFLELESLYNEAGAVLDNNKIKEYQKDPPDNPSFPFFIFSLAVVKDTIDVLTGGLVSFFVTLVVLPIVWLWLIGKVGMGSKFLLRKAVWFLFDSIPLLSFAPVYTVFVLIAHNREKKAVQILMAVLEAVEKGKLQSFKKLQAGIRQGL